MHDLMRMLFVFYILLFLKNVLWRLFLSRYSFKFKTSERTWSSKRVERVKKPGCPRAHSMLNMYEFLPLFYRIQDCRAGPVEFNHCCFACSIQRKKIRLMIRSKISLSTLAAACACMTISTTNEVKPESIKYQK